MLDFLLCSKREIKNPIAGKQRKNIAKTDNPKPSTDQSENWLKETVGFQCFLASKNADQDPE